MANTYQKHILKPRLLVLARMLYQETDEDHPMNQNQIIERLEQLGVRANEKTLRDDIRLLIDAGFGVVKVISRPNLFFWGDREFEMPELELLMDAVSSSRFITEKKSKELKKKIANLASEYQKKELRRNVYATNRVKPKNESIYYAVNTVNDAISHRRKISFQYQDYNSQLEQILRNEGEIYVLSPYALIWNQDFYYVVGWSDKRAKVSVFRVDRIVGAEVLEEKAAKRPEGFSVDDYSKPIFDMFEGSDKTEVQLECRTDLAKYVVDRFGTDLPTEEITDDRFIVTVEVSLSPTFFAWIFQFGGGIRIVSPKEAVDEIAEMAKAMIVS